MKPDFNKKPKLARQARLQYDNTRSQDILLLPERVVKLNKTAAAILKLCNGDLLVSEIIATLESQFQQQGLEPDVLEFLDDFSKRSWLDVE